MSEAYRYVARTYVRIFLLLPLVLIALAISLVAFGVVSSLFVFGGMCFWGVSLGLHWKEYLAVPTATLTPGYREKQLQVGLVLSGGVLVVGTLLAGLFSGGSWLALVSCSLVCLVAGMFVTQFVKNWIIVLGFLPGTLMLSGWVFPKYFIADYLLGESVWPSLFVGGIGLCGMVLLVDRWMTFREESYEYWRPLLGLKALREYQQQAAKKPKGKWKIYPEWLEDRRYRELMGLPVGQVTDRWERMRLRYLAWNLSVSRFVVIVCFLFLTGWLMDEFLFKKVLLASSDSSRLLTFQGMLPMSLIFCLMPYQIVSQSVKYRAGDLLRPVTRREWFRESIHGLLWWTGCIWCVLTGFVVWMGVIEPERVFWGAALGLAVVFMVALFLFVNGLMMFGVARFPNSRVMFFLITMTAPLIVVFGQSGLLPTIDAGIVAAVSCLMLVVGVLLIRGAYRVWCAADIG